MITRETLLGGMNEVLPAENLPAGMAAAIENMYLDKDGQWRARQQPAIRDDLQFETGNVYAWQPVYMPDEADSNEDTVYVYFASGFCTVWYKTGYDGNGNPEWDMRPANDHTDLIDTDNVRVSYDAQQLVFVDGREASGAKRLTIDSDGVIHLRRFGTEQPKTFPTVTQIECAKMDDNAYTGMPVGSILFYAYCIVNEYGERSNPSPVSVCDTAQWLAKGTLELDEDYAYRDINGGSIQSVSVECPIPQPDEAKKIELYRASAEYFESPKPLDPLRLVRSQNLSAGTTSITVTDTQFASALEADYENDSAPAGDDIVLNAGTVFIANAVSEAAFAYPVESVWAITLTNNNELNYVNRWIAVDVRDDRITGEGRFEGVETTAHLYSGNRYRFIDSDMITPLTAYGIHNGTGLWQHFANPVTGSDTLFWDMVWLRIPHIQAATDKIIYLVKYADSVSGYGSDVGYIHDATTQTTFLDTWIDNPVRDTNCLISVGNVTSTPTQINGWQGTRVNKANALWTGDESHLVTINTSYPVIQYLEPYDLPTNDTETHRYRAFHRDNSIYTEAAIVYPELNNVYPLGNEGYLYTFLHITKKDYNAWQKVIDIDFGSKNIMVFAYYRGENRKIRIYSDTDDAAAENSNCVEHIFRSNDSLSIDMFLYVGWENGVSVGGSNTNSTNMTVATLVLDGANKYYDSTTDEHPDPLSTMTTLKVNIMGTTSAEQPDDGLLYYPGYWYLNLGEYIDDDYEILALSRFDTHFPQECIGVRDYSDTEYGGLVKNKNISIETLIPVNDKKPGKIRWSNGGAVPDLYEHNTFEEVQRIIPMRSYMPTDEHNTLLIWTRNNLLRLALSGMNKEASALITEVKGIGLQDPDCLVQVADGVIWSEKTGIYYLSASGLREIGKGRVTLNTYTQALYNPDKREVLFVKSDNSAMVYALDYDVWSSVDYGVTPQGFIEIDEVWHLLSDTGTYTLEPEGDDTTLTPRILTRKIPARNKINRLTLHSSGGTVKAYIHNHRLAAGYTTSPDYTFTGDDPKALPQLCGDYVQFEIETDSINSFDVEDRNNG